MPELPEVETIVSDLKDAGIIGLAIDRCILLWPKTLAQFAEEDLQHTLNGKVIHKISRRAKFILFHFTDVCMLIHLRMSGRLVIAETGSFSSPYDRALFHFSNHQTLHFIDVRKFGRIYLTHDLSLFFKDYGPEPLDPQFSWLNLKALVAKRSHQIKALLLNQRVIAGLGNIYVDEALWLAKLHPLRRANSLKDSEIKQLYASIKQALEDGIANRGSTLGSGKSNYYRLNGEKGSHFSELNVFRRTNQTCKRCGGSILRIKAAGRSTHFCPGCQK
ncbi:MAG: bifunctional DNA-formamidopyrimidine glycosylase/DNA-(apurinic or apyrimidinic site) lyase [Parachlamydiaceae bacterium]